MADTDRNWLVLLRDISHAVRIPDEPRIVASLVFDMGTGVVLASAVAPDEEEVLAQVCDMALTRSAGGLMPRWPDRVWCSPGLGTPLAAALGKLTKAELLPIEEVEDVHEAEDVFDSFVGHLAGRQNAGQFAEPPDWRILFEQVLAFYEREPWRRWTDEVDLLVEVEAGGRRASFTAIVLGNADVQYGLVLYRGKTPPAGLRGRKPSRPLPTPRGTLMLTFDEPGEVPPEFVGKARRYGWPLGAELVPVIVSVEQDRPGEPSREQVRTLTTALAALVEHDARGPVLVDAGPRVTSGTIVLADGRDAAYTIRQIAATGDSEELQQLRVHMAGVDLISPGTPIVMGSTSSTALVSLRRDARLHRPRPPDSPPAEGDELPLIVVVTDEQHGDALAASVAAMDPFGVSLAEMGGLSAVVLVGSAAAQMLMELPSGDPALRKFRSRLKASKGLHVVLIADEAAARGDGEVYGLFELHLPDKSYRRSPRRAASGKHSGHKQRKGR